MNPIRLFQKQASILESNNNNNTINQDNNSNNLICNFENDSTKGVATIQTDFENVIEVLVLKIKNDDNILRMLQEQAYNDR